jgi:hypothetical protein
MLFLALAVPATYLYARPSLEEIAKLRWLDDISVMISKSLAYAKPTAEVSPVDPIAAANVDEDLDYRIAQRTKSTEGWRSFLTAHPGGAHAQFARAELDKLVLPVTPPAPATVQTLDRGRQRRKFRARSFPRACHPQSPKPQRLLPMRSSEATKIVWNNCPIARQATASFGS